MTCASGVLETTSVMSQQAVGVGLDHGLCHHRQHGRGQAAAHRDAREVAAAEIAPVDEAVEFFFQHAASSMYLAGGEAL